MTYGREALRHFREQQARSEQECASQPSLLAQIPENAPMDNATLTVWNGTRFVPWDKWMAAAPLERAEEDSKPTIPADVTCVAGDSGGTKVWLVKGGERWFMYVGSRKPGGRRRDFASPYLEHAIRTAEAWYGAPGGGWRAEKGRDGNSREAADLFSQGPTHGERTVKGGKDDSDLGGL